MLKFGTLMFLQEIPHKLVGLKNDDSYRTKLTRTKLILNFVIVIANDIFEPLLDDGFTSVPLKIADYDTTTLMNGNIDSGSSC